MRAALTGGRPGDRATLAELEVKVCDALLRTDEAVSISAQELGFAAARLGEHATAQFSGALRAARAELADAFRLRQWLDDGDAQSSRIRRNTLVTIIAHCDQADCLLDEQAAAFDRLQDRPARTSELLQAVDHHVAQQDARISWSEQLLAQLAARYTPDAVAMVATSPVHARARLDYASVSLFDARQAVASDQRATAATLLHAAESAADQAESLLDAIAHLEADLTRASSALPAALREIDADIAQSVAPPVNYSTLVAAQEAAAALRSQLAGRPFDALGALRQVTQANVSLDEELAGARDGQGRQDRARAVLDQVMLITRSSVTAANDFITSRRGAVGTAARTRMAEARRLFHDAFGSGRGDPAGAIEQAQRADTLAQQAQWLAVDDVANFSQHRHGTLVGVGGLGADSGVPPSFGGPRTRLRNSSQSGPAGQSVAPIPPEPRLPPVRR